MLASASVRAIRGFALLLVVALIAGFAVLTTPSAARAVTNLLSGPVVLAEDFDDDAMPAGWTGITGAWSVHDGRIYGVGATASAADPVRLVFGADLDLDRFRLDATVRFESRVNNNRWAGVILDINDNGSPTWTHAMFRADNSNRGFGFRNAANNGWSPADRLVSAPPVSHSGLGIDVRLSIVVDGASAQYWYQAGSMTAPALLGTQAIVRNADGALGLVLDGATVSYDDIVVQDLTTPAYQVEVTGGTAEPATATVGSTVALTPSAAAAGYHFAGWSAVTPADLAIDGDGFTMPAAGVAVAAVTAPNAYTVAYDGNGATDGATAPSAHVYDAASALAVNGFVRDGYRFAGWSTTSDGTVAYADAASVTNLTDGTTNYYDRVTGLDENVTDFYRVFFAPGVGHCGGGSGPVPDDVLMTLRRWVENGTAPDVLPASSAYAINGTVRRRNLCPYPLVSKYDGKGDPADAQSFSCAKHF